MNHLEGKTVNRLSRTAAALLIITGLLLGALPALAAPAVPGTDVSVQAGRVQAFKDLVKLLDVYKAGSTVDWAAASALYTARLQATVRARDAEFSQQLDVAVTAALDAGASGQLAPGVAKQLVDKLLQKVFYLHVVHEFIAARENLVKGDQARAAHNIDEAIAYFEAVRGTVQKRDQAFSLNMEAEMDSLLAAGQQAVAQNNESNLVFLRRAADYTLVRTFYLAVATYAEKIPADPNPDNARIMMAEGWAFFQSLRGIVGGADAAKVEALFDPVKGDPAQISVAAYKSPVALAFIGHAREEIAATFAEWGKLEAVDSAAAAALVLRVLDAELAGVLGAQGKAEFDAALLGWVSAVRGGDRAKAEAHSGTLLAGAGALALQVHGQRGAIVLTIGSTKIQVGTAAREIEAAPYIGSGDRTMVPVRFVAEGLGARVVWQAETRTVQVTQGSKVILLPVGRAEATVDGQVRTLDAAAEIRAGRTFVPIRFVSEVLGARVQWEAATQQVIIMPAQ